MLRIMNTIIKNDLIRWRPEMRKFKTWSFLDQQEHSVQWSCDDHLVTVGLKNSDFRSFSSLIIGNDGLKLYNNEDINIISSSIDCSNYTGN